MLDYEAGVTADDADASVSLTRAALNQVMAGRKTLRDLAADGQATVDGDQNALGDLAGLLDEFEFWWPIVTP